MSWSLLRSVAVVSVVLVAGCGGDDAPAPALDAGGSFDGGGSDTGEPEGDAGPRVTCEDDADCDDSLFCNGSERCAPDDPASDRSGCLRGTAPDCDDMADCTVDACSEETRACT